MCNVDFYKTFCCRILLLQSSLILFGQSQQEKLALELSELTPKVNNFSELLEIRNSVQGANMKAKYSWGLNSECSYDPSKRPLLGLKPFKILTKKFGF